MPSRNIPLGILDDEEFSVDIDARQICCGDRIYIHSDGLIEARNVEGQMFGQERLEGIVRSNGDRNNLFDEICEALAIFRDNLPQDDDITIVEVQCDDSLLEDGGLGGESLEARADYEFTVRLGAKALSDFDPLCLVKGLISSIADLERHQSYIYTILIELYANALEHGILTMDCSLKETPGGFARYYSERERLLSELTYGWMQVDIQYFSDGSSGELILQIEDSGMGFDSSAVSKDIRADTDTRTSGRGLELVRSFCKSLTYDLRGNRVRAVYAW